MKQIKYRIDHNNNKKHSLCFINDIQFKVFEQIRDQNTPLGYAINENLHEITSLLLVETKSETLHKAAANNNAEAVSFLISQGADVNKCNEVRTCSFGNKY